MRSLSDPSSPRLWRAACGSVLAVAGATIAVLWWLGSARGDPALYFDEWEAGTYASAALLVACAIASAAVARRLAGSGPARFWGIVAAGFGWLAYDEVFRVHERLDRWVHRRLGLDPSHPVTDHLDDLVVALYGVAALFLAWRWRRHLVGLPRLVRPLAAAAATGLAMFVVDVVHDGFMFVEESLKLVTGALLLCGILGALLDPDLGNGPRDGPAERDRSGALSDSSE